MKIRKSKMIFFKDSKIVLVEKKDIFFEPAHFCASLCITTDLLQEKIEVYGFSLRKKKSPASFLKPGLESQAALGLFIIPNLVRP